MNPAYTVAPTSAGLDALDWNNPAWRAAQVAAINHFHPKSSSHHPKTTARLLRDDANLYLNFEVHDQFVVSKASEYQQMVCLDSCVEFFVEPPKGHGYFNFEINCGGTLLVYYIEDPTRTPEGFVKYTKVPPELGRQVAIAHSMPAKVDPEISTPTTWHVTAKIPLTILESFVGSLGLLSGQIWRGNFYKCADKSSHPHWGSWSPIGEQLNFHEPKHFGEIRMG